MRILLRPHSTAVLLSIIIIHCPAILRAQHPSPSQRTVALQKVASDKRVMFQTLAARIRTGEDTSRILPGLDSLLNAPKGDIFWFYPAAGFYMICKDKLNEGRRAQFRHALNIYTPYRGDTENHFLMYYMAWLLFAQEFPDLTASDCMNGKSARENYNEAYEYLNHWIDETVRTSMTEWDSPRYIYYYLTPLLLLSEYANDPVLRRRCSMMTEYVLADFAPEYLNGCYTGAHSRQGESIVIAPRTAEAVSYGQYFFEDSVSFALPDLAYAACVKFQCPQIIADIAHQRNKPYVHTELKRSRAKIRFSKTLYDIVPKYTYMTSDYALGSITGGLQQPIQQHSWDVTFADARQNNTVFSLHPFVSTIEPATFFPEEPEMLVQNVMSTKAGYGNPNKWVGGSLYEHLYQHEGTLIILYDLPNEVMYPHVDAFFPKSLDTIIRHPSGWIIGVMGNAFVAVYPLSRSYEWIGEEKNWRLRINRDTTDPEYFNTGFIVECASRSEMSPEQFIRRLNAAIITAPKPTGPNCSVSYKGLRNIFYTASVSPRVFYVNGKLQQPDTTMAFNGPFVQSKRGSGIVTLKCNGKSRSLDFVRNRILDSK